MFCCVRNCLNGNIKKNAIASKVQGPEIHLDPAHMGTEVILLSNYLRITGAGGCLATAPLVQSKSYFEVKIQQKGTWSIGLATRQADLTKKFGGLDNESWCLCSDNVTRHKGEEMGPVVVTIKEPKLQNICSGMILNGSSVPGLIGIEDINEDFLLTTGKSAEEVGNEQIKMANVSGLQEPSVCFPDEGDIVGVSFDHIELNFYINGKNLEVPFRKVKASTLYPVVFVGNGAILDIILNNFHYAPPVGFENIMLEQSLL